VKEEKGVIQVRRGIQDLRDNQEKLDPGEEWEKKVRREVMVIGVLLVSREDKACWVLPDQRVKRE